MAVVVVVVVVGKIIRGGQQGRGRGRLPVALVQLEGWGETRLGMRGGSGPRTLWPSPLTRKRRALAGLMLSDLSVLAASIPLQGES